MYTKQPVTSTIHISGLTVSVDNSLPLQQRYQSEPTRFNDEIRPAILPPVFDRVLGTNIPSVPSLLQEDLLFADGSQATRSPKAPTSTLQASSLVNMHHVGIARFWAKSGAGRLYECTIHLADHSRLTFNVTIDKSGIEKVENGVLRFLSADGTYQTREVGLAIPTGKQWSVEADLPVLGKTLFALERIDDPRETGKSILKVRPYKETIENRAESSPRVEVKYDSITIEEVIVASDVPLKGGARYRQTWEVTLSNGDVISFWFTTGGHPRNVKPEKAVLNRFSELNPKDELELDITHELNSFVIKGEGYAVKVPYENKGAHLVERPVRGKSECRIDETRKYELTPIFLDKKGNEKKVESVVSESLFPQDQAMRDCLNPPWDTSPRDLIFSGKVGKSEGHVKIRGCFKDGKFSPDSTQEKQFVTSDSDGVTYHAEILQEAGEISIKVSGDNGCEELLRCVSEGSMFGFFRDPEQGQQTFQEHVRVLKVAVSDTAIPSDWKAAEDVLYHDLSRMFSRSVSSWKNDSSIFCSDANPNILKVTFNNGKSIYLSRHELGDEITYKVVNFGTGPEFRILGSKVDLAMDGVVWSDDGAREVIHPWRADWTVSDVSKSQLKFGDARDHLLELIVVGEPYSDSITFKVKKEKPSSDISVLEKVENLSAGNPSLRFRVLDGHDIIVTQDNVDLSMEDLILVLSTSPEFDSVKDTSLEDVRFTKFDPLGNLLIDGELDIKNNKWIVRWSDGKENEISLSLPLLNSKPLLVFVPETPTIIEPITIRVEHESPAEVRASTSVAAVLPRLEIPWVEGQWVLPSHGTRMAMRKAELMPRSIAEGTKATFEFLTEPHAPNGSSSAREIFRNFNHHSRGGENSTYFFGWTIKVPMTFHVGRWVPDEDAGNLLVERRVARNNVHRVVGNRLVNEGNTQYPFKVKYTGDAWEMHIPQGEGASDKVIRQFHTLLTTSNGQTANSPDWGISLGTVVDRAYEQLRIVEEHTGAQDYLRMNHPFLVSVKAKSGFSGLTLPKFGQPTTRLRTSLDGLITVAELSPGYSKMVDDLFSEFHLTDGNGLDVRVAFQHKPEGVSVVGAQLNSEPIDNEEIQISRDDSGQIKIAFFIKRKISRMGNVQYDRFEVTCQEDDGNFSIDSIRFGSSQIDLTEGMSLDPKTWTSDHIMEARETKNVRVESISITKAKPSSKPEETTLPTHPPEPVVKTENRIYVPAQSTRNVLADPSNPMTRAQLISFAYYSPESTAPSRETIGVEDIISFMVRYDDSQRVWLPQVSSNGKMRVTVGRESKELDVSRTLSDRNWVITVKDGQKIFFGNFYTNETERFGVSSRPTPVLWESSGSTVPHRRVVNQFLVEQGLSPQEPEAQRILPNDAGEIIVNLKLGDRNYSVPMRTLPRPVRGGYLIVPREPARTSDGQKHVVHYYFGVRTSTPALEVDGAAFEIRVKTDRRFIPGERNVNPRVVVINTHPGASGLLRPERSNQSIRLEADDPSALVLVDGHSSSLRDLSVTALESADKILRRQVYEAVKGETYEVIFKVSGGKRRPRLTPVNIGVFDAETKAINVIGAQIVATQNGFLFKTHDGHYLTIPRVTGDHLVISSHGRVVPKDTLLRGEWRPADQDTSIFSTSPEGFTDLIVPAVKTTAPKDRAYYYYKDERNRQAAALEISNKLGIPLDFLKLLQEHAMPLGFEIKLDNYDDNTLRFERSSKRGGYSLSIEMTRSPKKITKVSFYDEDVPFQTFTIKDRTYLALGGKYPGVLFYLAARNGGRSFTFSEITPPQLREIFTVHADSKRGLPAFREASVASVVRGSLTNEADAAIVEYFFDLVEKGSI